MEMVGQAVGVLGGTFDPVHNGHLAIAGEVMASLKLNEIIFIPAGNPRFKPPSAPVGDRFEMVRLALEGKSQFKLSHIETENAGISFTVDTVSRLKSERKDDEFYFIMGWDSFNQLPLWKEPLRLIRLCRLVAVPRPGCTKPDLDSLESSIPGLAERVVIMDGPLIDISSTEIRKRVAKGLSIHGLVPEAVARYIREHRLYTVNSTI